MRRPGPLPANEQCRTPKRVIALHCETVKAPRPNGYALSFAEATIIEAYRQDSGEWSEPVTLVFDDPAALWEEITDYCRVRARTWLVSYLAGNELRLAQAFHYLPALGWTMNPDPIVGDSTLSLGWHDDAKRSLLAVDLFSYLAHDLRTIQVRTEAFTEVDAIFRAFLDLTSLQHDFDLGNFSRTGASNASNQFRHCHMTERIYVHDDEAALAAEKESIFAGRTEAWRIGTYELDEWDLPLAYSRIGLDTYLPVRLLGHRTGSLDLDPRRLALVHALVKSMVPTLPARNADAGINWPVGTFKGWYWQPELDLAAEYGAEITPLEAYVYEAAPVLSSWAEWIIASQTATNLTPVQQMATKHWGRALIGKFGAQIPDWRDDAWFDDCELELSHIIDTARGVGERLTVGGRSLVSYERRYTDHAFPALMSRVISECRMRLWHLMCVAGLESVYYVDTDSLLVDRQGSNRLRAFTQAGGGWGVRIKTPHINVSILGPRQLIIDGNLKVSGLPRGAKPGDKQAEYLAQMTESFRGGAARGHPGEVVSAECSFTVRGSDTRRNHLEGGRTAALSVGG